MANIYNPIDLGIKPPSGGFQQGGWYSSRQYWGGTLSDPGVIHPGSTQQGAGQVVSPEVVSQTSSNNQAYIDQQRALALKQPVAPAAAVQPSTPTVTPQATAEAGATPGASSAVPTFTPPETPDLAKLLENLYSTSGVREKEEEYNNLQKGYTEAKGKINDNPFLSEATRVGRVAKIEQLFNERTANIKGEIATKKADIEMKLNLQLKQIDINSQQIQQNLSQFNTLLGLGALDNATGEDIADWTRKTGISSSMIQGAIAANKRKTAKENAPKVSLHYSTNNNTGEVTAISINEQTGEIVNKTSLGMIGERNKPAAPVKATESEVKTSIRSQTVSGLSSRTGQDGYVSPDTFNDFRLYYITEGGGNADDYNANYSSFINPQYYKDYGVSAKIVDPDWKPSPTEQYIGGK